MEKIEVLFGKEVYLTITQGKAKIELTKAQADALLIALKIRS